MTVSGLLLLILGMAVMVALRESWADRERCYYCGEVARHESHCPYRMLDE